MRRPSRRISRLLGFTVVAVSRGAPGRVVTASSYSVFNATTSNTGNAWTSGSITLTDDDSSGAMFTVTNLKPGQSGSRCIVVTYTGNTGIGSNVKLYSGNYSTTGTLGSALNLTITQGTGSSFSAGSACTGFSPLGTGSSVYSGTLAGFSSNTSYANTTASNVWATTGTGSGEVRVYKFDWSWTSGTPATDNPNQGKTTGIDFIWEAQTT